MSGERVERRLAAILAADVAHAIVLLRQALAIDPSYAPAAARVALVSSALACSRVGSTFDDDIAEGLRLAHQALEAGRDDPDMMWQAVFALLVLAGEPAMVEAILDRALTPDQRAGTQK